MRGPSSRRRASAAVALLLASTMGGCADAGAAARQSCVAESIAELRCRAIVADAAGRLDEGGLPLTAVAVRLAGPADRTTLRDQQLVAVVTFSFLDGSAQEVPVFCAPRRAREPVCVESP
jgi:hypothetical protein